MKSYIAGASALFRCVAENISGAAAVAAQRYIDRRLRTKAKWRPAMIDGCIIVAVGGV